MSFAYSPIQLTGSAGGGSSVGGGRITVGNLNATYTSVSGAIAALQNTFDIITDVTESAIVTVPASGLQITISAGSIFNIGTGNFNVSNRPLSIEGNGTIRYAYTNASTTLFSGTTGTLAVEGITIDNNGTVPVCITNMPYARFSNVIFDGDVTLCADELVLSDCIYRNGNIMVASGADDCLVAGSIFEGVAIIDSGVNTLFSDGVVT